MGFPVDPMPGGSSDPEDYPPPRYSHRSFPGYDSIWGWSSGVVVFMAMFFTAGLVFAGIACAIHHVLWAAIVLWVAAVINICYWSSQ